MYFFKIVILFLLPCLLYGNISSCQESPCDDPSVAAAPGKEKIDCEMVSRALGHYLARHLKTPAIQYDINKVIEGMHAEMKGIASPMTEEAFSSAIAQMQAQHFEFVCAENLKQAEMFLEKNGLQDGVISINEKLQYRLLKEGKGEVVAEEGTPIIHFSCELLDGTVLSSSEEMGEPISLPLKHALSGIRDGIRGMKQGEKRCLYIHPKLGFEQSGQIPPNSLLVFKVEVVEVQAPTDDEPLSSIETPDGENLPE